MKNYNNEEASVATILIGLLFSLTFSSIVIAFLLVQVYGVAVTGIDLPGSGSIKLFSSNQDYKNGTFDAELNHETWYGNWEYIAGSGWSLVSTGLRQYSYLVIKNIQSTDQKYTNSYWIDNSVHGDFCVGMRITAGSDTNEVCVNSQGIYIPDYIILTNTVWGSHVFVSYPNANQIDAVTIKTVYDEEAGRAIVYFNGAQVIDTTDLEEPMGWQSIFGVWYGGISSNTPGIILEDFQTENPIQDTSEVETNTLVLISGFIITLVKIVAWNVDSAYLPLELNLIFIKTQLAGVIVCAIMVIRGVG